MIIKSNISKNDSLKKFLKFIKKRRVLYGFLIMFVSLYAMLFIYMGAALHVYRFHDRIMPIIREIDKIPFSYVKGLISRPERLVIDINHKNFQKLAYNRKIALERGLLFSDVRDEVPASVRYNGKSYKVSLRLKGDGAGHWADEIKWSFRVKVKDNETIFGMTNFSIQHPNARNYLNEWVTHQLFKHAGLIALRYDFIQVEVNGKDWGVYAVEEHFDKRLVENNGRREGVLLRFNEDVYWAQRAAPYLLGYNQIYFSAPIDSFQTKNVSADKNHQDQFRIAMSLLDSFREGKLQVHQVFDVKKTALLFAIVDLFGNHHSTLFRNIRFYFNPITSRIEPIGYDNQDLRDLHFEGVSGESILYPFLKDGVIPFNTKSNSHTAWLSSLFRDEIFVREYVKALYKISQKTFLDNFFAKIEKEMDKKMNILYKEFPLYVFDGKQTIYGNQEYIRNFLNPVKEIQGYFHSNNDNIFILELGNIHAIPIEIIGVSFGNSVVFQPKSETILASKDPIKPVDFKNVSFIIPHDYVWTDSIIMELKVQYRLIGMDQIKTTGIIPYQHINKELIEKYSMIQKSNIEDFEFLSINERDKTISFNKKHSVVSHNLIIPPGYQVLCSAGTTISLVDSANIISYSPMTFMGDSENQIVIHSHDGTGQGVVVLNAEEPSLFEHVVFKNLASPSQLGWKLTGAVTFYESPLNISHSQFIGNKAEDSLNIVRSEFTIDTTLFKDATSDAFDADFTKGIIQDSVFLNSYNDAIDVSGSIVELDNIHIDGAGDKGVSVGENSHVTIQAIEVERAGIALTSKDLSELSVQKASVSNCKLGFSIYQKKSEFGPAILTIDQTHMNDVETFYLLEQKSRFVFEGDTMKPNHENIKDILYGVQYGRESL